ncbi:hypothetical protein DFJ77DRAFT_464245 [Powellomyces hirtus]|nr:hypothetical protein DFJ77DRAFT_464245 [Powellomyces hirtus]
MSSPPSQLTTAPPPPRHLSPAPARNSTQFVLQATAASGVTGSALGALLAAARGQSRLAWAFGMGANWVVVAGPFFALREGVLHYRYAQNAHTQTDSYRMRNKDEIIASIASGAVVGAGLGLLWRGPKAMIAGSLMYAMLACGGQTAYLLGRQYRLREGLKQRLRDDAIRSGDPPPREWSLARFWEMDITRPESHLPAPPKKELDPLGDAFVWARDMINANVDMPDWTSPMLNAWDIEYRKRLSIRLGILEVQVRDLNESVAKMRRMVGESNADSIAK